MLQFIRFHLITASTVLLLCVPNAFIRVTHAQSKKCNAEGVSISRTGKIATEVTFINQRSQTVKVYWLDYSGKRKFYSSIQPGDRVSQSTYVTHPWVVTDTQDNCLGVYYPDGQPRIVEIN
ncbi:hypothetical protein F7734_23490 [Scytonema sp. UIC 10036]|uniref:VHL beta domain-containing protein n=1 Tax=Scytonema sp. UIC 10036 TaxID=2304196 RepID=UPI0012DACB24|nr:hypothetical protein [Scytonema sp. UIC 10036]MUG95159.1 hypothetical protein [Scytonema sp. UIC 10036]